MKDKRPYPRGVKIAATVRMFVAEILRDLYPNLRVSIVDAESNGTGLQFVRLFYQGEKFDFSKIKDTVRYELAHRMNQKFVPDLDFVYDSTLETAERIEEILKEVRS